MPETDLLDPPKHADSKLSSIGAPPKQPDTQRGHERTADAAFWAAVAGLSSSATWTSRC